MIYSLQGTLDEKTNGGAVVVCSGVGYFVSCSANTLSSLPETGDQVYLYTIFSIKENAVELNGFASKEERELFRLLCSVNGVGSKLAFSILSSYLPDRLILIIGSGDSHALTSCPGVGNRIAQRIVVELKDKVSGFAINSSNVKILPEITSNVGEALAALVSLGFSNSEASRALASVNDTDSPEQMITEALRLLAIRK